MALRKTIFGRVKNKKKLFLDEVPNQASYAVALRKLSKNYSGYCIRVRRSSDDQEMNIGFSGDIINIFSLLLFAGSGDLFVSIWYDQSGKGQNFTQISNAAQPQIVSSGSIILEKALPTIKFTTATWMLQANNDEINEVSVYYVNSVKAGSQNYYAVGRHTPTSGYGFALMTSNGLQNPGIVPFWNGRESNKLMQINGGFDVIPTSLTARAFSYINWPDTIGYKNTVIAYLSQNEVSWGGPYYVSGINLGYNDSKANMNLSEYIVYPNANRSALTKLNENVLAYYNI